MKQSNSNERTGFWYSKTGVVFLGFLAIAGYVLWNEHRAHVIEALPWLLLGGCLVMHLFMHHGHKHGGHGEEKDGEKQSRPGDVGKPGGER